ncbi:pitrilysin family protein [Bdellovibrionota bacterium FG-1]
MKNFRITALSWVTALVALCSMSACATQPTKKDEKTPPATVVTEPVAPSANEPTVPLVGDSKVHRFILDNGLRLLVVEDHRSPTFAYQTWFKVGSRDEIAGRTGLAHLFEHMMFKETKNFKDGEFDKILEGAGAEGENAFTSRDYTAYVQEMPSDKLDLIMRMESDRMVNLLVNEKAFKTETDVVQNERRFRNENSPDGLMYQEIYETAFTQHPYHWPVVGYQKDLDAMHAQDALDFYHGYYSPNHATLVVTGDVVPAQVFELAKKYYGSLVAQTTPGHLIAAEPPQEAPRRKRLKLNIQVEKLLLAYHIPGILDSDMATLDVLQAVLTGGKSSRLYRALVETGIAANVDAYDIEDKDPSIFIFTVNLQKGKKAADAETIIIKELARLTREPVTEQEMERAKNRIQFGFYEGLESNAQKANFLGHYEAVANDFTLGLDHFKKVPTVTAPDIRNAAKKYFNPTNRTVITGVNK